VSIPATVTDPGANDTLSCDFDWGDGEATNAVAPSGSECTAAHAYASPDVYTVVVTVTDDDGASASTETSVVVYDPTAGFVTGGGWFDSAAGSYKLDSSAEGRAAFGFVSRYRRGATTPSGATAFVFRAGGFLFFSHDYDWLVVTGRNYAKFKGTGTINGSGAYKFQIWAGDDDPDTFRIKIWTEKEGTEEVVYDNGTDQALGGGRIRIHQRG
jgi:PKD repeat protein